MSEYDFLPVSDGSGDTALMHITDVRLVDATTIKVDTVENVPTKFIATYGSLLPNGLIDPATKIDFKGHLSGADIIIDAFEPGNTDAGNTAGQVVIIKPNVGWANRVATHIKNLTGFGTPEPITASTLVVTSGSTLPAGDIGTADLAAAAVTKAKMEKPHYNSLYFATNGGTVFGALEVTCPYNASDTTNGVGIVANTTNHTLTIARDGIYRLHAQYRCADVAAIGFITWIFIVDGTSGNTYSFRKQDESIGIGNGDSYSIDLYLVAGTVIHQEVYNGGGSTRFGYANDGGTADDVARRGAMSLTVTEMR